MLNFREFVIGCVALFLFCFPLISQNEVWAKANRNTTVKAKVIKGGNYTLECGKYKGYETDYDYNLKKPIKKEVVAELKKNEILINGISEKFRVKGNHLYVKNTVMYEILGNNTLLLLAGGGIIFEHE